VLAFNSLYLHFFNDVGELHSMLKTIHDSWLNAGGYLAVLSASSWSGKSLEDDSEEIFYRLGYAFKKNSYEELILGAGFVKKHYFEFSDARDFSNPDEALLRFYSSHVFYSATDAEVRCLIKELYPGGKAHGLHTLALFQKAL